MELSLKSSNGVIKVITRIYIRNYNEYIRTDLALALITTLYAVILSMVVATPIKTGLQQRLNEI